MKPPIAVSVLRFHAEVSAESCSPVNNVKFDVLLGREISSYFQVVDCLLAFSLDLPGFVFVRI